MQSNPLPCFRPQHGSSLHSVPETRSIENEAMQASPPHLLMGLAGKTAARLAIALHPGARTIWVACGPGNNGGDGLIAASELKKLGIPHVCVSQWRSRKGQDSADRQWALQQAVAAGVDFTDTQPANCDLAIDALLGIGSQAPLPAELTLACQQLAALPCPVLCVDLPSGLNADTGSTWCPMPTPTHARYTLSMLTLKPGLFTGLGRDLAGEVWFAPLLQAATSAKPNTTLFLAENKAWAHTPAPHQHHKGSHGDVLVIGGQTTQQGNNMAGAAVLAGRAALHSGAGRVFVAFLNAAAESTPDLDIQEPGLMLRNVEHTLTSELDPATVIVCGCGGGHNLQRWMPMVLARANPLVLDADALNHIASDPDLQRTMDVRAAQGLVTVLTPHPLEAARLRQTSTNDIQNNRLQSAQSLSKRWQCITVLKGSGTVVADAQGVLSINGSGNALLATAGTGDVLAGMVGAALARHGLHADHVRMAVYAHGRLADTWPRSQALSATRLAQACMPTARSAL